MLTQQRRQHLTNMLLVVGLLCFLPTAYAIDEGSTAPEFTLAKARSSEMVSLTSLRGKPIYLDFWATWCPSCKLSMPWLNDLAKRLTPLGVHIVAVSVDSNIKKLESYLSENNFDHLTILSDPKASTAEAFHLPSFPTSFIIDSNGKVVRRFKGFKESDKEEIEKSLRDLL